MNIKAVMLAGIVSLPLLAGAALSAETGKSSLASAAKQGDRNTVRSLLNGRDKKDVAESEDATAALIWAAYRNDLEMADVLLYAGANAKGANEYGANALYARGRKPGSGDDREAAGGRRRSQRPPAVGRNPDDGSSPPRQPRLGPIVARRRRRCQCAGNQWRTECLDVGGVGAPVGGDRGTDQAWRRHPCQVRSRATPR